MSGLRFVLRIDLGNEAMRTGRDVAHALVRAGGQLERDVGHDFVLGPSSDAVAVLDENGNTVGGYYVYEAAVEE